MSNKPTEFVIRLRPLHDRSDLDGVRRLRGALKHLLRGWRLRCTHVSISAAREKPASPEAVRVNRPVK